MKKSLFVAVGLILISAITSCKKANEKLTNNWTVTESCTSGNYGPYTITLLEDGSDEFKFKIQNLYESGSVQVTCEISSSNDLQFTAARQAFTTDFEIEITSGSIASDYNSFTISYAIYDTFTTVLIEECDATANRQ